MRILLISPSYDGDIMNRVVKETPFLSYRQSAAQLAPLSILTVAALTPDEHTVEIHDENTSGPVEQVLQERRWDIIGISCISNQLARAIEIGEYSRKESLPYKIVLGGPGISAVSKVELFTVFDALFFGEAEETWPQYLEELKTDSAQQFYQQVSKPDMTLSPIPRWDLVKDTIHMYNGGCVQTTRGCPFDCAFCDVIYLYGRKPRSKSVEQVMTEIKIQADMGIQTIFISDDDFAGNKKYAKEFLRELKAYNHKRDKPLAFTTQADLTIASDEEMLELMADCNFAFVCIGLESVNEATLRDLNKLHNVRQGVQKSVAKIQGYGIAVLSAMIFGSDADDKSCWALTENFLKECNIVDTFAWTLVAPPGTKTWYQIRKQGRLLEVSVTDLEDVLTNIVPKQMTRSELLEGTADYLDRIFDPDHWAERAVGFFTNIKRMPVVPRSMFKQMWANRRTLVLMFWYFMFQADPKLRRAFFRVLRTTRKHAPNMLANAIVLSVRFLTGVKRYEIFTVRMRKRAALERQPGFENKISEAALPVPDNIRNKQKDIVTLAYQRVKPLVENRELLYKVMIEAVGDFIERWGETFTELDAIHRTYVVEACDRVIASHGLPTPEKELDFKLRTPPGFVREIIDRVDHSLRAAHRDDLSAAGKTDAAASPSLPLKAQQVSPDLTPQA